jgi:type VI secretion system protein VasD
MSADFYSLQNPSANALGSAQLNTQQFFLTSIQPHKTLRIKSLPEARFIGIMAEYQALDGKVWRLSLPVPEGESPSFWAFWKRDDGELNARIVAGINGLRVEKQ